MNKMLNINKPSENVNKQEIFKKLFSTWKFNLKAISYTTFEIFGWYLLQKMNFFRIHVIFDPKWFPSPGAHQGQIFLPLLVPMVSTIIGPMIFFEFYWELRFTIIELSRPFTQLLLNHGDYQMFKPQMQ